MSQILNPLIYSIAFSLLKRKTKSEKTINVINRHSTVVHSCAHRTANWPMWRDASGSWEEKKKKNLDEMFICQGYKLSISCPQAYLSAFRILHT